MSSHGVRAGQGMSFDLDGTLIDFEGRLTAPSPRHEPGCAFSWELLRFASVGREAEGQWRAMSRRRPGSGRPDARGLRQGVLRRTRGPVRRAGHLAGHAGAAPGPQGARLPTRHRHVVAARLLLEEDGALRRDPQPNGCRRHRRRGRSRQAGARHLPAGGGEAGLRPSPLHRLRGQPGWAAGRARRAA